MPCCAFGHISKISAPMNTRRYLAVGVGVLLIGLLAWGVMRSLERLAGIQPAHRSGRRGTLRAAPRRAAYHRHTVLRFGRRRRARCRAARSAACRGYGAAGARNPRSATPGCTRSRMRPLFRKGRRCARSMSTERGDAFVDLSPEVSTKHSGGSSTELLTVYAIVNAVAANLPTIQRVQILIDGREVDTLAGHVDLRRPLERDFSLVRDGRVS